MIPNGTMLDYSVLPNLKKKLNKHLILIRFIISIISLTVIDA